MKCYVGEGCTQYNQGGWAGSSDYAVYESWSGDFLLGYALSAGAYGTLTITDQMYNMLGLGGITSFDDDGNLTALVESFHSTQTFYLEPDFDGSISMGGIMGGTNGVMGAIARARATVSIVLSGDNSCAGFLNRSAVVETRSDRGVLSNLLPPTAQSFFESDHFYPDADLPSGTGAVTIAGAAVGAGAVIGVNSNANGAFLGPVGAVGPFTTGSPGAQAIMLLHELAHTFLAIPPDLGNTGQSVANTETILKHCLSAVQSALGSR